MPYDPRMLSFEHWTSLTAPLLASSGSVPVTGKEDNWQDWANSVKALPAFGAVGVPSPKFYTNWQDWGYRLNEVLLKGGP
jgi:hypothetical protein